MVSWRDLELASSDIAHAGRRLLADDDGRPGVAFLATVDPQGQPRLHPIVPAIVDASLYAFVMTSPKRRDLDRTGAFALHSCLGRDDESFFVAGRAHRITDEATWTAVAASMPYDDVDDTHGLYEFSIERALWTTWSTPSSPVYRRWSDR